MKLAACYNVYDGVELLKGSMESIKDHVDLFVIVYQDVSNFGDRDFKPLEHIDLSGFNHILIKYSPSVGHGHMNEIRKRNLGIQTARRASCTHFLHLDVDEYYLEFGAAKEAYIASGAEGSVCGLYTYFKRPTFRFENPDNYYVPFIHKIEQRTKSGNTSYPFRVDPTRRINQGGIIELPYKMHHYSWVRADINRKIRNSSARNNIRMTNILNDYKDPNLKGGYFVPSYEQRIVEVENYFNISI